MKLYYYATLALLLFASNVFGQSATPREGQLFSPTEELQAIERQQILESNFLSKADLFSLDAAQLESLYAENRMNLTLSIPMQGAEEISLHLERVFVTSPDLKVYNSYNELIDYEGGRHYRGKVVGQGQSLAAISIFEGEVMGVIAFHGNSYNLEKLRTLSKRTQQAQYIFYAQQDVAGLPQFACHTEDEPADLQLPRDYVSRESASREKSSVVPIRVYMECDNKMYKDFNSSVGATVDYTTGLFNVTAGLFADAGVTMEISEIKVWNTTDPYGANSSNATSSNSLSTFRCEAAVYNGRLAHLLSTGTKNLGGLAQRPSHQSCPNGSANHGFSNITTNYSTNLNTYSWSVEVLTHELGHQMSSSHTHACAWNGNNTPIDDCGSLSYVTNNTDNDGDGEIDEADEAEGFECWDRNNPIIPNKGTIMSYCHLRAGNGIDLSLGFHPQVREQMAGFADGCIEEAVSCFAPAKDEIFTTEVTEFSIRLNCSREGVTYYYFSYRLAGEQDWINSGVQEESFWDLDGLTPNTNYEVRMFLFCNDWSGQSCIVSFKTAGVTACTGFDVEVASMDDPTCEASNGSVTLNILEGTPNFNASWTGPVSGSTSSNIRTITINDLPEGDYTINVTDNNDCETRLDFRVTDDEDCAALRCQRKAVISCGQTISASLDGQPNDYDADDLRDCLPNATGLDGPDQAYEIVLTEQVGINIRLSGLSNDMDMYILNTCIEGNSCLGSSLRTGTTDEAITGTIGPGTYYILIDRFEALEGGNDDYELSLSCGDCNPDYKVSILNQVAPACEMKNGSIDLIVLDGIPGYTVTWDGPTSGTLESNASVISLENLAAGDYNVTVEDNTGCKVQTNFSLTSGCICNDYSTSLDNIVPIDCDGNGGDFDLNISSGQAPYTINIQGTIFAQLEIETNFYEFRGLPEGSYQISIIDANDCVSNQNITIDTDLSSCDCDLDLNLSNPISPSCDNDSNGSFTVSITGGTADFNISWTGASTGNLTTSDRNITLDNLPAGDYIVNISDAEGCLKESAINIQENLNCTCGGFGLSINNSINPNCDASDGKFDIQLQGGTANFTIQIDGPVSVTQMQGGRFYSAKNLPQGEYSVSVTDENGCVLTANITLSEAADCEEEENLCEGFALELKNSINPNCDASDGKFDIQLQGGTANFTIQIDGPVSVTQMQGGRFYSVKNLPQGEYSVSVTDENGCVLTANITLNEAADCEEEENLCEGFALELKNAVNPNCDASDGKFDVTLQGGTANFTIQVDGPVSITQMQGGRWYSAKNLPQGEYSVSVTDENGCVLTANIMLNEADDCEEEDLCEGFALELKNAVNPNCDASDGKFDIQLQGGTANFTIQIDGPVSITQMQGGRFFSAKNLPQGEYSVSITDENACVLTANITLSEAADCEEEVDICEDFALELKNAVNPNCDASDGKFDIQLQGGTANFTIQIDGPVSITQMQGGRFFSAKNLPQGEYSVSVTDENACVLTANITLSEAEDCSTNCEVIESIECGASISGTTIGATNDFVSENYDCYNQAASFDGGDVVYELIIASNTARLTLELKDMSKDLDFFLLDACSPDANCIAESGHNSAFLTERIRINNPVAGTYYIVVDATSANENSDFTITSKCTRGIGLIQDENFQSNISTLEAFPNPTTGNLLTRASFSEATTARVEIINAMGQIIASHEVLNTEFIQHQFDLSAQAAGVYFLKLQTATSTEVEPIVLMR